MKHTRTLLVAAALAGASMVAQTASAQAVQTAVFSLTDIGNFANYTTGNTGQTFSGKRLRRRFIAPTRFAHLFGLEGTTSRTNAQVDLTSLLGSTIQSATLSYSILNNYDTTGVVTITGSAGKRRVGLCLQRADGELRHGDRHHVWDQHRERHQPRRVGGGEREQLAGSLPPGQRRRQLDVHGGGAPVIRTARPSA